MTPYQRTQRRVRHLQNEIERFEKQATLHPEYDDLPKWQVRKLKRSLQAQLHKLHRYEAQDYA